MQLWKTISKRLLCQPNRFLTVELHELELPDGKRIVDWPWLITPDYANVLARTKDGRFLCFRQTKYAVEGVTLAPVGGFIEPGEDPMHAAQRELREETGYESPEWHTLGSSVVDANRGAGIANLFLALDAEQTCPPHADDLEQQELLLMNRAELEGALDRGEFKVLAWMTVIALGLRFLDTEQKEFAHVNK
jgi:ADP-ribose pyrophosphatase